MAVQINVAANQAALTASIQAGVQAYNQRFAQNNQLNLTVNQRAFSQPLGRMTGDVKDFEAALAASNARVIAFGASTAVLGGVIRSFKELASVTIDVEKNLADINRVFGLTTAQLQKFSTDLFSVSKQTASSFDDASKAALEFSRQGLKAEETLQRTKDALTLTRLAGIGTANAVDALTSTVNGFAATGITTTQILNKLVAVEQDYAVGAGDLAEALSRTGQAAQEAGVSLDQLNALVTAAQQSTARGGAVIGNALKTIFTRLQRTETLDQLEAFNIAVRDIQGNALPAVQILQNFAGAYKTLGDAQRAQLSEQVAGVYQVNILKAIVGDLNKSQGVYAGALKRGAAATNEAEVATAKLNQTLDALLKQTATSTQQLANNIGKVTFEPLAKYGTEQLKSFIEGLNTLLEGDDTGALFANGFLKGIRNVIAGPGAIAAFFTLFKLIQNSFTYLSQALPQIAGITTETQNRKNIEQSILQIMQQQGPVSQALAGTMGNQAAQAQLLLQVARQQTAEYQMQTTLAKQLAVQLAGQGVRVKGSGGLQVTRSGGYIPASTKMAEVVGAKAGGYSPGRVVSSPVGGVMNTAEDVKYIPGFAQPFINPPANSKAGRAHRQNAINRTGIDPYMFNGFVPNFSKTTPIRTLSENKATSTGLLKNLYDFDKPTDLYSDPKYKIDRFSLPFTSEEYDNIAQKYIDRAIKYKQNIGNYKYRNTELSKFLSLKFNQDTLSNQNPISKRNNLSNIKGALGEIDTYKYFEEEYYQAEKMADNFGMDFAIYDDESNIKRLVSLVETKTTKELVPDKTIIAKTLTYLGQKGKYKNNSPKADIITLPSELAIFQPKGLPTNNIGFIPNFATPMTTASIPWFKKYSSKYKNASGDTDLFKMGDFPTYGRGLNHEYAKKGNSAMLSYLHEDFVRSALNIALGSKKVIRPAEVGFKNKPVSDIANENDFDLLYRIADGSYSMLELKQDFKNISGSVSGFMNKKLANLEKENPVLAKKVSSMIAVSNRPKFTDPTGRNAGANFSEFEMAAASIVKDKYSNVDPSISAKLTKVTDGLLRRYEAKKNTTYDGFIPNFANRREMFRDLIKFNLDSAPNNQNILGGKTTLFRGVRNNKNSIFGQSRNYSQTENSRDYFRNTDIDKIANDHISEKKLLPFVSASTDKDIAEYFARGRRDDNLLGSGAVGSKTIKNSRIFSEQSIRKFIDKYGEKALKDIMLELSNWGSLGYGKGMAINFQSFSQKKGFEGTDFAKEISFLSNGFIPNLANYNTDALERMTMELAQKGKNGATLQDFTQFVIDLNNNKYGVGDSFHKDIIAKNFGEIVSDNDLVSPRYANTYLKGSYDKNSGKVIYYKSIAQQLDPLFERKHPYIKTVENELKVRFAKRQQYALVKPRIETDYGTFHKQHPSPSTVNHFNNGFIPNLANFIDVDTLGKNSVHYSGDLVKLIKDIEASIGRNLSSGELRFLTNPKTNLSKLNDPKVLNKFINSERKGGFAGFANGFVPNFAYKQAVMGLEESMSGNKAILDTSTGPFPFIRNTGQANFADAIADHGGLNNALSDSMRGQKAAGLMSKGFVPNFARNPHRVGSLRLESMDPSIISSGGPIIPNDIRNRLIQSINGLIKQYSDGLIDQKKLNDEVTALSTRYQLTQQSQQKLQTAVDKQANIINAAGGTGGAGGATTSGGSIMGMFGKFGKRFGRIAGNPLTSIAGNMLAGQIESFYTGGKPREKLTEQERFKAAATSNVLSSGATGLQIGGMVLGPLGAALGGVTGGLIGLVTAINSSKTNLDDLTKIYEEKKIKERESFEAASEYIQAKSKIAANENIKDANKLGKEASLAFANIKDSNLKNALSDAGNDVVKMTNLLNEYTLKQKEATLNIETFSANVVGLTKQKAQEAGIKTVGSSSGFYGLDIVQSTIAMITKDASALNRIDVNNANTKEKIYQQNESFFKMLGSLSESSLGKVYQGIDSLYTDYLPDFVGNLEKSINSITELSLDQREVLIATLKKGKETGSLLVKTLAQPKDFGTLISGFSDYTNQQKINADAAKKSAEAVANLNIELKKSIIYLNTRIQDESRSLNQEKRLRQVRSKTEGLITEQLYGKREMAAYQNKMTQYDIGTGLDVKNLDSISKILTTNVENLSDKQKEDLIRTRKSLDLQNPQQALAQMRGFAQRTFGTLDPLKLTDSQKTFVEAIDAASEELRKNSKDAAADLEEAAEQLKAAFEEINLSSNFMFQFKAGFRDLANEGEALIGTIGRQIPKMFADGLVDGIKAAIRESDNLGQALMGIASKFLDEISTMMMRSSIYQIMGSFAPNLLQGSVNVGAITPTTKQKGGIIRAQSGMYVSGSGSGDKYPALLENGEYVLNRRAVMAMGGPASLDKLNFAMAPRFASGGSFSNEFIDLKSMEANMTSYGMENSKLYNELRDAEISAAEERRRKAFAKKQERAAMIGSLVAAVASIGMAQGMANVSMNSQSAKAQNLSAKLTSGTNLTQAESASIKPFIDKGLISPYTGSYTGGTSYTGVKSFFSGPTSSGQVPWYQRGSMNPFAPKIGGRQTGGLIGSRLSDTIPGYMEGGLYNTPIVKRYGVGMQSGGASPISNSNSNVVNTTNATNSFNFNTNVSRDGTIEVGSNSTSYTQQDVALSKNLNSKVYAVVLDAIKNEQRFGGSLAGTRQ